MEITDIKTHLSIKTVLEYYNLEVGKNHQLCCPFHDDKTPSLKIYPKTNTYNCFGCGKTGDVIQFIQDKENLSKHEALKKATELASTTIDVRKAPPPPKENKDLLPFGNDLGGAFLKMQQNLNRSKKALTYLEDRGLNDLTLEQGFNGNHYPKLTNCIIYPLNNKANEIVSFYGRKVINKGTHYYLTNRQGLYPGYPTVETQTLILTESVIDATTILKYTDYKVLALYGVNGFTAEHTEAVSQLNHLKEIILFLDGDTEGRKAVTRLSEQLRELRPQITISKVATPDDEDPNSLVQNNKPEILDYLIEKREILFSLVETAEKPIAETRQLNTENPEYIIYKSGSLQIAVLGGIPLHNLDRLKVTLRINRTDNNNNLYTLRQSGIDLYNDDVVTKLIRKLAERLELGTKEVQHALYNLITELENYRLKQIEVNQPEIVKKRRLTEKQKQDAIAFLQSENLLQKTNELIGLTGLVGEEKNRILMYLVFTSRLREQPLHIISLGASGTGKTYLQEKISELIPQDQKLEITTLSENALYYFDRTELKNKLVLIEDLDGAQDDKILYAIRELMSKKRISKTIPIKDAKGNLKTITLQVEGPISLAGTTTKEKIYEDNANRSILIYLDNSSKQKDKIISYQQQLSAGLINKEKETQIKEFLKDVQSVLEPVKVRNPYATELHIPETVFKPLRTNAHYLSFIEVITFYHQYQRQKENGYVLTDIKDIEIANALLKEVILAKSDELTKASRDFLERIKKKLAEDKKESFYASEIRDYFRINPKTLSRYLIDLQRYNYLKVVGGSRYRAGYEYEIVNSEDYEKLQQQVITALDKALLKIKNSTSVPQ